MSSHEAENAGENFWCFLWCFTNYFQYIKIHPKRFQITHRSMALPILKITLSITYFICLALEKSSDEKQKFSRSRPIKQITRFLHRLQPCEALQTSSRILWFINFKKTFLKSLNLMSFTWIMVLFFGPGTHDCV